MAVTVEWDNDEKTILRYIFTGRLRWGDYYPALQQGREMMDSVSHKVCILNDMRNLDYFPPNMVSNARSVISSRPANTGLAIFLTRNSFFKVLYKIIAQVVPEVPTGYLLVDDADEAYRRLNAWLDENQTPSETES